MKKLLLMMLTTGIVSGFGTNGFCGDEAPVAKDSAVSVPLVTAPELVVDSLPVVDRFTMFSVDQKKYLKTLAITNAIYASGFGLLYGLLPQRAKKVEGRGQTEGLKLLPLTVLSEAMMFVSLPMSVAASRRAERNYELYYKEGPRNLTFPFLFVGGAAFLGATALSYVQTGNDFRDNNEMDNSYTKYATPATVCFATSTIIWAGTNLYSLIYVAALGKKAKSKTSLVDAIELNPWNCNGANGMMVSWMF